MAIYDPQDDALQERGDRLDESIEKAAAAAMQHFDWLDLPDDDAPLCALKAAMEAIFSDYLPDV